MTVESARVDGGSTIVKVYKTMVKLDSTMVAVLLWRFTVLWGKLESMMLAIRLWRFIVRRWSSTVQWWQYDCEVLQCDGGNWHYDDDSTMVNVESTMLTIWCWSSVVRSGAGQYDICDYCSNMLRHRIVELLHRTVTVRVFRSKRKCADLYGTPYILIIEENIRIYSYIRINNLSKF